MLGLLLYERGQGFVQTSKGLLALEADTVNELVSPEQITGLYLERRLMETGMSEEEARAYARDYKTAFAEALKSMMSVGGKGIVKYQGIKMCFERTGRDTFEVYKV